MKSKYAFKGLNLKNPLQLFSDNPPTDPPTNPPTDPPTDPPVDKTFTQDDVNGIVGKEVKKAQEKFLKSLGIEDFNSAKDGMEKFRAWQESQKTDSEKQAELLKRHEADLNTFKTENSNLKAQLSATSQGVKADSLNDVITLANSLVTDEVDINKAIETVLTKYPHFKGEGAPNTDRKPQFSHPNINNTPPSSADLWLNAFNRNKS